MVERETVPKSLVRGANGCRELGHFPAICLCVLIGAMFYDAPYGTPYFPFYRPRESMGYSRGKRGE